LFFVLSSCQDSPAKTSSRHGSNFDLTEREIVIYIRQVCEALQFLHSQNYAHFDIKPDNIIYTTRKSSNIKITEMGQARLLIPGENVRIQFTSPEYYAPEVHQHDMVSTITDMWSVGVLAYMLLSGLNPFASETTQKMIEKICNVEYTFEEEAFKETSIEAMDFVDRLLIKECKHRMTAAEALEHPWLKMKTEQLSNKIIKTLRHRRYYQTLVKKDSNFVVSYDENVNHYTEASRDLIYFVLTSKWSTILGTVKWKSFFTIGSPPKIEALPEDISIERGKVLTVACAFSGDPVPDIEWTHLGRTLPFTEESDRFHIETTEDLTTLIITSVKENDAGSYTLKLSNELGSDSATVNIRIRSL
uniref:Protein kinase domain-containing protein n=1 Tax=Paramormyrops kingsleyae TaxID=1676925 RepID=A0A3B3Q9Y4_9TELE